MAAVCLEVGPCSYALCKALHCLQSLAPPGLVELWIFGLLLPSRGASCAAARLQDCRQGRVEARLAQVLRQEVLAARRQTVLGELADQLAPACQQLRLSPYDWQRMG